MQATFEVDDFFGHRILVAPPEENNTWAGNPISPLLDIEARTGTRLRDSENPIWFIRLYHHFQEHPESNSKISFSEFVSRRHSDKIDTVPVRKKWTIEDRVRLHLDIALDAIPRYKSLRSELFKQLVELKNLNEKWKIQYARNPAEGDASLKAKITHHTSTKLTFNGQPFEGIATLAQPETFAPIKSFTLLDELGGQPAEGSPAAIIELRLEFLLNDILKWIKRLARALEEILQRKPDLRENMEVKPLLALETAIPTFPYWPGIKGFTSDDYERILEKEQILLNDAEIALREIKVSLTGGMVMRQKVNAPDDRPRNSWLELAVHLVPAMKYAVCAAGILSLVAAVKASDEVHAVVCAIIILGIMVLVLIFERLTKLRSHHFLVPAILLAWSFLVLTVLSAAFLFTSAFFSWPQNLKTLIGH